MNQRIPSHIRNEILKIKSRKDIYSTSKIIKEKGLNTVCSSSRCPNLNLCFSNKTATFLMLGDKCTRQCPFCNIEYDEKSYVDISEPENIAYAVKALKLNHAVITMVTRDDIYDGGASIIAAAVKAIKSGTSCKIVEVLTSDFMGNKNSINVVFDSGVDIFGHNIETVEKLYDTVRPQSSYVRSLDILDFVKKERPHIQTKSGIMVGLGESKDDVFKTIDDIASVNVDFMTIGQYMRPSVKNIEVKEYVSLKMFIEYREYAKNKGIKNVFSAPLVRSSFGAEKFYNNSIKLQ
ncbi:MAG: lipoyl synthase [Candidatus Acididesulfobacter guangdongensis]|uniref:Lipoyl synthase n=1 Tax=Acididesulfobacter guangdongensis TaxID=2597225 RepID=A0A519BGT1_ACIG2|nr:MAG: lipoyl synthase [Candidatus Acididesulfobacter guangdongensis]